MKQIKTFLLAFALVASSLTGFAQLPALGVLNDTVYPSKDTLDYLLGETDVNYTFNIVNKGTADFKGDLYVFAKYNANPFSFLILFKSPPFIPTIVPGDSLEIETPIEDIFTRPYQGGHNVIVIWPAAANPGIAPTVDTVETSVYIGNLPASRIRPIDLSARVNAGPNPVKDELRIVYLSGEQYLEHVRLIDMTGKVVFDQVGAPESIPFAELSDGLYLIEFIYTDGTRGSLRVLHRN